MMERGTVVTVKVFNNRLVRKRVWKDAGRSVHLTYEREYQRALREHDEAEAPGWRRDDIVEVHGD